MKRSIAPLLFGLLGAGVLIWLGVWQMQRLEWKEGILAEISSRITAPPVALPPQIDASDHKYLPVTATGSFMPGALRVLVSQKKIGAGYRIVSPFRTADRVILVDRGFIKVADEVPPAPTGTVTVTGNLHWPDERLNSTPENDVAGNTWFARDVAQMAEMLNAEPVLMVTREMSQPESGVTPLPVDTSGIPNDHLSYAITWFSLALIWLAMTGSYIWRGTRSAKGETT